jgi:hypothetical protein
MPSCERCWQLAHGDVEQYYVLLKNEHCTPEQQAGPEAKRCHICGRKTLHQYCNVCMNPDCGVLTNE